MNIHEETLEIARSLIHKDPSLKDWVVSKFPELKEVEDEMIRKEIIQSIQDNMCVIHKDKCIAWLEKQGEQKHADKIELKFHSGDFITDGERIFQIKETVWERNNRNDGTTYCESLIVNLRDGVTYTNNTDLKGYHLWAIQDAKDGDVISFNDGQGNDCIELIKSITDLNKDKKIEFWFCLTNNEIYEVFDGICPYTNITSRQNAAPATKEQRDLLFKKMHEAGYEWNAEKLELKKIKQEQTELPNDEDYGIDSLYHAARILEKTLGDVEGYQSDDGILEHKCAIEAVNRLYKQKPAWSEEDEKMCQETIDWFEKKCFPYALESENPARESIKWLKSLKERMKGATK